MKLGRLWFPPAFDFFPHKEQRTALRYKIYNLNWIVYHVLLSPKVTISLNIFFSFFSPILFLTPSQTLRFFLAQLQNSLQFFYNPLCPLVGPLVVNILLFRRLWAVLGLKLLPNCLAGLFHHCPCPPARDLFRLLVIDDIMFIHWLFVWNKHGIQ